MLQRRLPAVLLLICFARISPAQTTQPAVQFPSVVVDRAARQIRVDCEALVVDAPLEFFCVTRGGPEHESVLRTAAKPSHIHAGLLMLGLEPGSPMKYSDARKSWSPPYGPPLRISVQFSNPNGKVITLPATQFMSHIRSREAMQEMNWIFAGSNQRDDGAYLADLTGYVVSLVNFEHTLIDVPQLISSANGTLEWETNPDLELTRGQAVTMILEPLHDPTTSPSDGAATRPMTTREEVGIEDLRKRWQEAVAPHKQALKDAAQTHYEVIAELRRQQQALIDQADRLQRLIDELEKQYSDLTTPTPP